MCIRDRSISSPTDKINTISESFINALVIFSLFVLKDDNLIFTKRPLLYPTISDPLYSLASTDPTTCSSAGRSNKAGIYCPRPVSYTHLGAWSE